MVLHTRIVSAVIVLLKIVRRIMGTCLCMHARGAFYELSLRHKNYQPPTPPRPPWHPCLTCWALPLGCPSWWCKARDEGIVADAFLVRPGVRRTGCTGGRASFKARFLVSRRRPASTGRGRGLGCDRSASIHMSALGGVCVIVWVFGFKSRRSKPGAGGSSATTSHMHSTATNHSGWHPTWTPLGVPNAPGVWCNVYGTCVENVLVATVGQSLRFWVMSIMCIKWGSSWVNYLELRRNDPPVVAWVHLTCNVQHDELWLFRQMGGVKI